MFKKYVTALGSAVCEDMMSAYYNIEGIDRKAVEEAVGDVIGATETAVANSNIFFDRGPRSFESHEEYSRQKRAFFKALFNKVAADYSAAIDAAMKKFNAAVPAAVKEANKSL